MGRWEILRVSGSVGLRKSKEGSGLGRVSKGFTEVMWIEECILGFVGRISRVFAEFVLSLYIC